MAVVSTWDMQMKSSSPQHCAYPVESCQERSVDKVGKDNEGVSLLQVEEEDGRDEGHALDNHNQGEYVSIYILIFVFCYTSSYLNIAKVWSVADVCAQQVPQCRVIGTALLNSFHKNKNAADKTINAE